MWKSKYEALAKLYSQLRQEHLDLLGKFKTVQLKANSAQEAVDKMEKMQKEIKDKNLQMADMVRERDRAKNELLRWQNTQNDEIARLKRDLEMANGRVEDLGRSKSSEVGSMVAKFNKEKQDLEDLANVSCVCRIPFVTWIFLGRIPPNVISYLFLFQSCLKQLAPSTRD